MNIIKASKQLNEYLDKIQSTQQFNENTVSQITNIAIQAKSIILNFDKTEKSIDELNKTIKLCDEYLPKRNLDEHTEHRYRMDAIIHTKYGIELFFDKDI
jgi:hypothetical protein